jgi:prepilin-type N-terminal cleavage/methylation domain-containing protein
LLQRLRAARQNQSGFTLTELLIVIVILGVLAGIVVFAVAGLTERGVKSACEADKRTVQTAVEAYHAQNGNYPTGGSNDDRLQDLIDAELLRDKPSTDDYTITVADTTGLVGPATC